MPKILIISKYYYPFRGGIEENARYVAEYAARFHNVVVLASNHERGSRGDEINGVTVFRKHVHYHFRGQPISLALFSGINLSDYDLIHFHSPNPFATAYFLVLRLFSSKAPLVVTHHMDIFGRKFLRLLSLPMVRHLIRKAAVTIVTSAKNIAVSRDLPKDANYKVVPLAVLQTDFNVTEDIRAEALEWRRSISGDAPLIGFVGRHARYKGLVVLMEALSQMPGVHAVIGGTGPYRQSTEDRARQLGVDDRVHFVGRLSHHDKLKLLVGIDVFVFPSTEITEAFGISQMEAMICGTPVVASNLPTGVTDVAIDGETALLATPSDPVDLAAKIKHMLDDRELAANLAEAGRRHVLSNMTYDKVSARTLSIFEDALAGSRIHAEMEI